MVFSLDRRKEIRIGDLVSHYLYTSKWIGLVLKLDPINPDKLDRAERYDTERALIKMIPGTKHQNYFIKAGRKSEHHGWVYCKWLWILKQEDKPNEFKKNETNISGKQ